MIDAVVIISIRTDGPPASSTMRRRIPSSKKLRLLREICPRSKSVPLSSAPPTAISFPLGCSIHSGLINDKNNRKEFNEKMPQPSMWICGEDYMARSCITILLLLHCMLTLVIGIGIFIFPTPVLSVILLNKKSLSNFLGSFLYDSKIFLFKSPRNEKYNNSCHCNQATPQSKPTRGNKKK